MTFANLPKNFYCLFEKYKLKATQSYTNVAQFRIFGKQFKKIEKYLLF